MESNSHDELSVVLFEAEFWELEVITIFGSGCVRIIQSPKQRFLIRLCLKYHCVVLHMLWTG